MDYFRLADAIRRCPACVFHDPALAPIPPAPGALPARLMFVGESPSWAADQAAPFDPVTISGQALDRHYLAPLGLTRAQVWISNLLKCRYPAGLYGNKPKFDAEIQHAVETCVRLWLFKEIALAQPEVLVTLGDQQVYQRLRRLCGLATPTVFEEAVGRPHAVQIGERDLILFPMIHPDISRPEGDGDDRKLRLRQQWAPLHHDAHLPALRRLLEERGILNAGGTG